MNREQAKELLPVIKAWVEGKKVQYLSSITPERGWQDYANQDGFNPISFSIHNYVWRIKPEKKTAWINIYGNSCGFESKAAADKYNERTEAVTDMVRTACIQITYEEGEGL